MIWQYFLPNEHPIWESCFEDPWSPYHDSPSNGLAILRVNRYISNEISLELYRKRTLKIVLNPQAERWAIVNATAKPCHLRHANLCKFQKLEVEIVAPNIYDDRGQVSQLRDSSFDLLCVLLGHRSILEDAGRCYGSFEKQRWLHNHIEHSLTALASSVPSQELDCGSLMSDLPPIELIFQDASETSWCEATDIQHDPSPLLVPFCILRRFSSMVTVSMGRSNCEECKSELEVALGNLPCLGVQWLDWLKENDLVSMAIDLHLDWMTGPTASELRLLRYQQWSAYEMSIKRQFRTWMETPGVREAHRHFVVRRAEFEGFDWYRWSSHDTRVGVGCSSTDGERGRVETWRLCFPNGIGTRGSWRWWRQRRRALLL